MRPDDYCLERLLKINNFHYCVTQEGASTFQKILSNNWFQGVKDGIQKVCEGNPNEYNCRYLPFRWLCEEGDWEFVNSEVKKLEQLTKKKKKLRKTFGRLVLDNWMHAESSAFEISAICKFMHDNVFIDLEPKVNPNDTKKADVMINIDNRDILVELTSIHKGFINPEARIGSLSVPQMKYQVISKIKAKSLGQLSLANQPTVLVIALHRYGSDQFTAKWAIEECLADYSNISAVIVSDSYRFKYGAWYFNNNAEYKLTPTEMEYLSQIIKLNANLAKMLSKRP